MNKRKAMIGWLVYTGGATIAKRMVKSIHETRYGEFLGLVMVGPHVTDLVEAGVIALDAEATVETIADGMTAHPTLSEAIKEAGLVALGRAIHLPNKKRAKASA